MRIAPKVLLPERGLRERSNDTLCQKSGYPGRNGQRHESGDPKAGFGEVAPALSKGRLGAQDQAHRPGGAVAGLPSQGSDSGLGPGNGEGRERAGGADGATGEV